MYTPDDPSDVEFDIEDMAYMSMLKLAHDLPGVEVPYLDAAVVARADKPAGLRVKRQRTDK